MKLVDYLSSTGLSSKELAEKLGVTNRCVWNWTNGVYVPRRSQMRMIVALTGGAVMPNDFLVPGEREAAE